MWIQMKRVRYITTRHSYQPISHFNIPCKEVTSVRSMFVYNNICILINVFIRWCIFCFWTPCDVGYTCYPVRNGAGPPTPGCICKYRYVNVCSMYPCYNVGRLSNNEHTHGRSANKIYHCLHSAYLCSPQLIV